MTNTVMDLYGTKSESSRQKAVLLTLETLLLFMSYWILMKEGGSKVLNGLGIEAEAGNESRRVVFFVLNCVIYLRMWLTIAYLMRRGIPWQQAISVPFAFAVYYIGYALLGFRSPEPLGLIDQFYIIAFLGGSFINTFSELLRHRWKSRRANRDHLYTGGLFNYAVHINYFGDLIWATAYAALTRNPYAFIIPVALLLFFISFNIPKLDHHLSTKYGDEFKAYSRRTRRLIPFIY